MNRGISWARQHFDRGISWPRMSRRALVSDTRVYPQSRWHGLARIIGSAGFTPWLLIAAVACAQWSIAGLVLDARAPTWATLASTLACVGAGCIALAALRPQRMGLSPPHVMLSLGFGGMLLGLAADAMQHGPQQLDSLCAQASALDFVAALRMHMSFLPAMHGGMLLGGLLAIPGLRILRPHCGRYLCAVFTQNLLCSGWMLLGMTGGAVWMARWLPPLLPLGASTLPGMLGGMFGGMTWGMVVSVALFRGFFRLRDLRAEKDTAQRMLSEP